MPVTNNKGKMGASLRARRRGEPERAHWQAAARTECRALPAVLYSRAVRLFRVFCGNAVYQ